MTEARVEEDPGRIEPDDMTAIIAALDDIAVSAEPEYSAPTGAGGAWTLTLRWLQDGPVANDTEAALSGTLNRIREHFALSRRTPPERLELRDRDDQLLFSVEPGSPGE